MDKTVTKVWIFQSDSNPNKSYESLQYSDGSVSCGCPGWCRGVAADGTRSCKHTRLVDMGRADYICTTSKDYLAGHLAQSGPAKVSKPVKVEVPVLNKVIVRKISWR